jgi:two-component system cell cycle sensor histidine kinase/response regulator CckA
VTGLVTHAFLRGHRDEIVREWESLVTAHPGEVKLVESVLRDHLPEFLEELADWLEQGEEPGTTKMRAAALRYALDRLEHSYQLSQLLWEFRLLRTTILRLLLAAEAVGQDRPGTARMAERTADLARLNAGLDIAMTDAVESFVAGRDRRLEELRGEVLLRDAADRQRAEERREAESLREQLAVKDQLVKIAESVPGAIYSYRLRPDGSACMPFSAPAMEDLFGISQDVLAQDMAPYFSNVHPDDVQRLNDGIAEAARTMSHWHDEYRYLHPTKGLRRIEGWSSPVAESDGSILWHGFLMDVTERRRAESALSEREALYRSLFNLTPSGVVLLDETGNIAAFNDQACRQLGYTREEFARLNVRDIDVAEQEPAALMHHLGSIADAGGEEFEALHRMKSGDVRAAVVNSRPVEVGDRKLFLAVWQDVTDRKRAEEALRQSEARFRTIFEQAGVGVAQADSRTGRIVRINQRYCDIVGYSREEMLSRGWQDITHPDDVRADLESIARLLAGNIASYAKDKRYLHRDGSTVWVNLTVSRMWSAGEEPGFHVAVVEDITARKQAEAALAQREHHLQTILHTALDGFYSVAAQGTLVEVNDAYCAMSGYSRDELLRMRIMDLDRTESPQAAAAHMERIRRQGSGRFESRHRRKDGSVIDIEASVRYMAEDGGKFLAFVRDITERQRAAEALRRSEERFRALVEKASDVIVVLDADLVIRFAATSALGFSAEEVVGRPSLDLVHAEDRQAVEEIYRDLIARPGATARFTARRQHKDGSWHVMEILGRNLTDDPVVQGVVLNMRDVTEQRRLEGQLLQAQKMEGIGRLAGGVAHDFNNILSVILTCAEFALESLQEGDPLREDILEIEKAGKRAATLTRQLLAFSRKQVLQPEPLDLNRILAEMERMLHRILGEDIDLVQALAPDLGIVKVDPGQVEQVIMNLAVNARDAMPKGGKLTIVTANVELDTEYAARHAGAVAGPHVMFAVSDAGVGMDEMTMARAFEPFFTTKGPGKGTGLGLSTVYGIVKQSAGSIDVYSEPGKGTTFKVYLPRELSLTPVVKQPAVTRSGGAETILVVEDDEAVRRVAKRLLDAAGYTVLTAANGGDGLLLCEQHPAEIHLVLTDVVMPLMGGRIFVERLAKVRPRIKALYMSGYTDNAIVHHGVLDAGTQFIGKPLVQVELLRKVREVLDG